MGWTNRGRYRRDAIVFQGATPPTNFYAALVRATSVPDESTNTLGQLTQIAAGTGYTDGGIQLARDSTDFNTLTEDDVGNKATIELKDLVYTANGGDLDDGGAGARYLVLTDDNVVVANREVWCWWDLASNRNVPDTEALTIKDSGIEDAAS